MQKQTKKKSFNYSNSFFVFVRKKKIFLLNSINAPPSAHHGKNRVLVSVWLEKNNMSHILLYS